LPKNRIEAFSDGVFSIVITLMAFDIKLSGGTTDLMQALHALLPKLNGFILSFAMVGMYWVAHHQMFHTFKHVNRQLMWLNLVFLLSITFLPFSTSLVGAIGDQGSVMIYGANLAVISLLGFAMWFYATRFAGLTDPNMSLEARRGIDQRILAMPLLALTSIAVSFFSVRYSLFVYYAIVILFLRVQHLDRHFGVEHGEEDNSEDS